MFTSAASQSSIQGGIQRTLCSSPYLTIRCFMLWNVCQVICVVIWMFLGKIKLISNSLGNLLKTDHNFSWRKANISQLLSLIGTRNIRIKAKNKTKNKKIPGLSLLLPTLLYHFLQCWSNDFDVNWNIKEEQVDILIICHSWWQLLTFLSVLSFHLSWEEFIMFENPSYVEFNLYKCFPEGRIACIPFHFNLHMWCVARFGTICTI